jgi:phosphoribosyl-ATP pyrophosphohydrolase
MQLGRNNVTGEDNEKDNWSLIANKLEEEFTELMEAISERNLIHIAEETFDVIQVCIRSLALLKKNGVNLEVENKQHNKKLVKRRWSYLRFIRVFWDK